MQQKIITQDIDTGKKVISVFNLVHKINIETLEKIFNIDLKNCEVSCIIEDDFVKLSFFGDHDIIGFAQKLDLITFFRKLQELGYKLKF